MLYPSTSCSAPRTGGRAPMTTLPLAARAIASRLSLGMPGRHPGPAPLAGPPGRSSGGVAARGPAQRPQELPGDLAVVERDRPVAQGLVRLVALAGDHHALVFLGERQGAMDRLLAIGDHQAALRADRA